MAKWIVIVISLAVSIALCYASSNNAPATSSKSQASGRQGAGAAITGAGVLNALSSMVPGVVSNMLPLVLLFGLGALMVPALGLGLLLREGRRSDPYTYYYRSFPSFNINTAAIKDGAYDIFERVVKAIENADKKYN